MSEREWSFAELEEFADERDARRAHSCRCGGDMPGRCPGPQHCPMCRTESDNEETEE